MQLVVGDYQLTATVIVNRCPPTFGGTFTGFFQYHSQHENAFLQVDEAVVVRPVFVQTRLDERQKLN